MSNYRCFLFSLCTFFYYAGCEADHPSVSDSPHSAEQTAYTSEEVDPISGLYISDIKKSTIFSIDDIDSNYNTITPYDKNSIYDNVEFTSEIRYEPTMWICFIFNFFFDVYVDYSLIVYSNELDFIKKYKNRFFIDSADCSAHIIPINHIWDSRNDGNDFIKEGNYFAKLDASLSVKSKYTGRIWTVFNLYSSTDIVKVTSSQSNEELWLLAYQTNLEKIGSKDPNAFHALSTFKIEDADIIQLNELAKLQLNIAGASLDDVFTRQYNKVMFDRNIVEKPTSAQVTMWKEVFVNSNGRALVSWASNGLPARIEHMDAGRQLGNSKEIARTYLKRFNNEFSALYKMHEYDEIHFYAVDKFSEDTDVVTFMHYINIGNDRIEVIGDRLELYVSRSESDENAGRVFSVVSTWHDISRVPAINISHEQANDIAVTGTYIYMPVIAEDAVGPFISNYTDKEYGIAYKVGIAEEVSGQLYYVYVCAETGDIYTVEMAYDESSGTIKARRATADFQSEPVDQVDFVPISQVFMHDEHADLTQNPFSALYPTKLCATNDNGEYHCGGGGYMKFGIRGQYFYQISEYHDVYEPFSRRINTDLPNHNIVFSTVASNPYPDSQRFAKDIYLYLEHARKTVKYLRYLPSTFSTGDKNITSTGDNPDRIYLLLDFTPKGVKLSNYRPPPSTYLHRKSECTERQECYNCEDDVDRPIGEGIGQTCDLSGGSPGECTIDGGVCFSNADCSRLMHNCIGDFNKTCNLDEHCGERMECLTGHCSNDVTVSSCTVDENCMCVDDSTHSSYEHCASDPNIYCGTDDMQCVGIDQQQFCLIYPGETEGICDSEDRTRDTLRSRGAVSIITIRGDDSSDRAVTGGTQRSIIWLRRDIFMEPYDDIAKVFNLNSLTYEYAWTTLHEYMHKIIGFSNGPIGNYGCDKLRYDYFTHAMLNDAYPDIFASLILFPGYTRRGHRAGAHGTRDYWASATSYFGGDACEHLEGIYIGPNQYMDPFGVCDSSLNCPNWISVYRQPAFFGRDTCPGGALCSQDSYRCSFCVLNEPYLNYLGESSVAHRCYSAISGDSHWDSSNDGNWYEAIMTQYANITGSSNALTAFLRSLTTTYNNSTRATGSSNSLYRKAINSYPFYIDAYEIYEAFDRFIMPHLPLVQFDDHTRFTNRGKILYPNDTDTLHGEFNGRHDIDYYKAYLYNGKGYEIYCNYYNDSTAHVIITPEGDPGSTEYRYCYPGATPTERSYWAEYGTGWYFIGVENAMYVESEESSIDYSITVRATPDDHPDSDEDAKIISPSNVVNGVLGRGDTDVFRIWISEYSEWDIKVHQLDELSLTFDVETYGPIHDLSGLSEKLYRDGRDYYTTATVPAVLNSPQWGWYDIILSNPNDVDIMYAVDVDVYSTLPISNILLTSSCNNVDKTYHRYECAFNVNTALPQGKTLANVFRDVADTHYYKFYSEANKYINIKVNSESEAAIRVYSREVKPIEGFRDEPFVWSDYLDVAGQTNASIAFQAPYNGDYIIEVVNSPIDELSWRSNPMKRAAYDVLLYRSKAEGAHLQDFGEIFTTTYPPFP